MNQSQENCLADSRRFTHEAWGGDYSSWYVCGRFTGPGAPDFAKYIKTENTFPRVSAGMYFFS